MSKFFIYLITNLVNDKKYVGKSNNTKQRWNDHRKIALGGKAKYPTEFFAIHAALNKYGLDNFKFEIIEEFENEDDSYQAETKWISYYNCNKTKNGYNCNMGGKGGVVPNEETIQKLIVAQNKPERIKQKSELMKKRHQDDPGFLGRINMGNQYTKGRKLPKEEKDNLSNILVGRPKSEITKQKMSEAQTGSKHSQAKFTEEEVLIIRSDFNKLTKGKKKFCEQLSIQYGVASTTIENIVYEISWRHI